ncbi:MAG: hypothetical protein ABRQ38_28855, partial [Candidatus Eremiobacterota bacterium]
TLFYIFSTALPVVSGNGNIYSMGSINLEGATVESGNTDNIALYSQGDITLNTTEGSDFRGLVYTTGNFHSNNVDPAPIFKCDLNFKDITLGQSSQCGNLTINGALIVAGQDPDNDPNGVYPGLIDIKANELTINYDDSIPGLSTIVGTDGYRILCWYDF